MQFVFGPLTLTVTSPEIDAIQAQLAKLQAAIETLRQELTQHMAAIDDAIAALTTQVEQNTTVEGSAVTLIQGLAAQIAAAATNPSAVTALAGKLKASADALASAITQNTPSAPPTPAPAG